MKTKKILLATSGATVDGRNISPEWLTQMANNYNPATYSAGVNMEHINGYTGTAPFISYGDVLELSVESVEVELNGVKENRTGLYGILDLTDEAVELLGARQKNFPSVEIHTNFAETAQAYCIGVAMTDTPASLATEKITFNRQLPGTSVFVGDDLGGAIKFTAETPAETPAETTALAQIGQFFASLTATKDAPAPEPTPAPDEADGFDAAKFSAGLQAALTATLADLTAASDVKFAALTADLAALTATLENTPAPSFTQRPPANGPGASRPKTDC